VAYKAVVDKVSSVNARTVTQRRNHISNKRIHNMERERSEIGRG